MAEFRRNCRKLRLLLWKQYQLRKNRYIISLFELLFPILVVYAIAKSSANFIKSKGLKQENATIFPSIAISDVMHWSNYFEYIVYAPDEPALKDLMKKYEDYVHSMPERNINITGVESENDLEKFLRQHDPSTGDSSCIGIVFTDSSALADGSVGGHLSYTFRSSQDLKTEEMYYIPTMGMEVDGPIPDDAYLKRGFVAVQIALNEAFMRVKGKKPLYDDKFFIEPFPYPEYQQEDPVRANVPGVVRGIVLITALVLSIPLITTIIEEKSSGVKELLKIVGMNEWLIWFGWFLHALFFSLISYTFVTYFLQHEFAGPNSAPIRNVDPLVLWSCIMLYCLANIAFCFMFTAIFHQTTVASSIYVLVFAIVSYGSTYLSGSKLLNLRKFACLLPNAAFTVAFDRIRYTEVHDIHLGWKALFLSSPSTLSLGYAFLMMIFDTALYLFLAYYVSAINPGKFGARKSPFFIFYPLRSALKKNQGQELVNLEDPDVDRFIEKPPTNLEETIRIKDLHKNFGSVYAVKGVNLNVYKDEITALLGHNGAGKTTTLEILTGLIKPTEGSIVYKGKLDVLKNMDEFRQNLGMCAQEDRLFKYLTVMNHLLFFGQLKGATKAEAMKEANEYLELMEMKDKANSMVDSLSGGMKRKLCLSIALMGKAETLILDEPTSGLDVESRRKLWDLLLEMRGSRTIILTTHHMEEADALGDRIAIMHHGTIVCHGTSLFLKKSYNTGYEVTITKNENAHEDRVTDTIQSSQVPGASLECSSPKELIYKLPLTETSNFPNLFKQLERRKGELGIESIGLSCTTMEQVFLKVGGVSMYDHACGSRRGSTVTDGDNVSKFVYSKTSGPILIVQQTYALFHKKLLYTTRDWSNLFFRVIIPTIFMILLVHFSAKSAPSEKSLQIDFGLYPNTKVMVQNSSDSWSQWESYMGMLQPHNVELITSGRENVTEGLLDYARQDVDSYKHDIILAMERNRSSFGLFYNRFALHSLPLGLNLFANHILQYRENLSAEVVMTSHPLNLKAVPSADPPPEDDVIHKLFVLFLVLAFYTTDLNTYFMTAINKERLDGFKHIQLMSNVSPITYWWSNFIFDYTFFVLIVLVRILLLKMLGDDFGFLVLDKHFWVLMLVLALSISSCLLFAYVMSYLSRSKDGSYLLLFLVNIISAIVVFVMYFTGLFLDQENLGHSIWAIFYRIMEYIVLIFPPMNYGMTFIKLFYAWNNNINVCNHKKAQDPNSECPEASYLHFTSSENPNGIAGELIFLVVDIILYSVLLSIIQLGYFEKLMHMAVTRIYGTSVSDAGSVSEEGDNDVQLEKAHVDRSVTVSTTDRHNADNVLIVHQLRKNFIKWFKPFTAVADVNFTVKASECFGLLGVNGAGKSTTFKMLTGDLLPTKGNSLINGFSLSSHRTTYLSRAGYCAQSNCFLEELSGREMLTLVASLRGIRAEQIPDVVDKWLAILGLQEYQNRRCGSYSGGNKRKLCTAMSLIGDPDVVFLDEPTSGVDPVARRRLYIVMQQSRESGQAVVLTSHSMEECENLCDRLTILVKGRMQCIGTAQHLKQTYAQGFSMLVKVSDTATNDAIETLKERIANEFNRRCVLKDSHKTQLYYQITDTTLPWSILFEKMEKLKEENHSVMEDYSLSDTSLEEVFISFAKQTA